MSDRIEIVKTLDRVIELWPFFLEALGSLTERAREKTTPVQMMGILMRVATGRPQKGVLMVLVSKNGKPFGFVAAKDNSNCTDQKSLMVLFAYINEKCPDKICTLQEGLDAWARLNGYFEIQAISPKFYSHKFFEQRLGFRRAFVGYRKFLCTLSTLTT